jgi:hypothetical protein
MIPALFASGLQDSEEIALTTVAVASVMVAVAVAVLPFSPAVMVAV